MCRLEILVDVDVVIASLGKARRHGGSSITFVQCISGLEYRYQHGDIGIDSSMESVYRYSLIGTGTVSLWYRYQYMGIVTLFRVSVPFDTGIGTAPLSTDTGSLETVFGVH
ncbi:hypothetical protein GQ457_11G030510 [Hibiscus cannabinus]